MKKTFVGLALLALTAISYSQSPIGGLIYPIKNAAGATIYRGQLVEGDSTSVAVWPPYQVVLTRGGDLNPIGTVYSDSIPNNGVGWMTTSGSGYVALKKNRAATAIPGDRVLVVDADSAGRANCEVTTSVTNHFREVGQPTTKPVGTNAFGDSICVADIHKN